MSSNRNHNSSAVPYERTPFPRSGHAPFRLARALLRAYGLMWGDRVLKGMVLRANSPDDPVEAVFVDPFAGADHPLPPGVLPVPVEVLAPFFTRAGTNPARVRAVLLEEDPVKLDWLLEALQGIGLGRRAGRATGEPTASEIVLVEGGWDMVGWSGMDEARIALALVDPPNAGRLPLDQLLALLDRYASMDLLLRFPIADLRRLATWRGVPLADLPPHARRSAEGLSRLLGDSRHQWAIAWRMQQAEQGEALAEISVVEHLAERLRATRGRQVRIFRVDVESGPEYLLIATADPTRTLLMNEVLFRARSVGWMPWPEEESDFVRYVPRSELELFGAAGADTADREARDRVVDVAALAHSLATDFAGSRARFRDVLASVGESALHLDDVRRALGELRKDGRAFFRSLTQLDSEVTFPRAGAARFPPPGRPRRRGEEPGDLFLALDPESE